MDPFNSFYSSADGVLFNKSQTALFQCPGGKAGSYTIPGTVTNIGYEAFHLCASLTNVTIADSVISIGNRAFVGCTNLVSVNIPAGVTVIGDSTFAYCGKLTSIIIPSSVTYIDQYTFYGCADLTGVYFEGNAPSIGSSVFTSTNQATIYYLPGATGWGPTFGGRPTALWQPQVETSDGSFDVRTNQFGFNITWAEGMTVVVEASTDLSNSIWSPLQTNTLTSDTLYFCDPQWTNYPARFYRVRWP